jgi:hypothetical protein
MIDEDIAFVRRVRPAAPPDDPAAKARAWSRLQAEFDQPTAGRSWSRTDRRRLGWRFAATGVVAAGAAAALVAVQLGRAGPPASSSGDSAVRTMELAAETVEQQTVARPGPDQWVYSQELRAYAIAPGDTIGMLRGKIKVEQWWRFDGRRLAESTQGSKIIVQGVLRPGEKLPPVHAPGVNGGFVGGPGIWSSSPRGLYDYVATLPAEPGALLTKIRHDVKDNGQDVSTFGRIAQILDDDKLIPAKTTAALYRALAKISGVTVAHGVRDFAGRPGTAVARTEQGTRIEIILDRKTYRYLGTRTERGGKVINDTADLDARVVDQPGQRG